MCGGKGTRLWPLSRESEPKQFTPLVGGISTFQQTLKRLGDATIFSRPLVITNADSRFIVGEQLAGLPAEIILESEGRDSAPAIAVAAELARRADAEAVLLVTAADHVIRDAEAFQASCKNALSAAMAGRIVTFGVWPTRPATSYGYIKPGDELSTSGVYAVVAFVEKPNSTAATEYVGAGYLWNSGNFMFRADVILSEIERFEPEIHAAATTAVDGKITDLEFVRLPAAFSNAPKKSIDYAVMERTSLAAVLPVDFGWSDVGSWESLWEELERDQSGNFTQGPTMLLDSRNILAWSDQAILTTVVGLDNLVVVSTPDAVLVVPLNRSEQVKELVTRLKNSRKKEVTEHRKVHRPWGYYQSVDLGSRYQVKKIVVKPGGRLSLQKHLHRAEHWVIVKGAADVVVHEVSKRVNENESIYVPLGAVHRLSNPGKIPLELIEVQVGSYLGEDDIVRMDDVYHRD